MKISIVRSEVLSGFYYEDTIWKNGKNTTSIVDFVASTRVDMQKYGGRNHQVAQFAGVLKRCSLYPASKAADIAQEPRRMLGMAKKNLGRSAPCRCPLALLFWTRYTPARENR